MKLKLGIIEDICETPERKSLLDMLLTMEPKPPVKVGYWLGKNARCLRKEFADLVEQQRTLILSLGAGKVKGNRLSLPPEDKEAHAKWDEGRRELRDIEIEVDIHTFSVEELGEFNPGAAMFEIFHFMFTE